jgi:hypothetical protein
MRALILAAALLILVNVQGCANSFETFMLGGLAGGTLLGCTHYCDGD